MIFKVPPQFEQYSMSMSKTRLSSLAQLMRAGAPCACASSVETSVEQKVWARASWGNFHNSRNVKRRTLTSSTLVTLSRFRNSENVEPRISAGLIAYC